MTLHRLSRTVEGDETVDPARMVGLRQERIRHTSTGTRVIHQVVGAGIVVGLLGRAGAVKGVPGGATGQSIMDR